ncbi:MAG TPA: hypothetical protein VFG72_03715 [Marmoricola sp.]|nr:hypothetical protein [Marmoricola sp.]
MEPARGHLAALVTEAARRSAVCWVGYRHPDGVVAERLVWHVWYDGAVVVLAGDAGQRLEGLAAATSADVTMRSKDARTRLVTWPARVEVVDPAAEEWDAHAAALVGARLNLADPEAAVASWRTGCSVVRLNPPSGDG